MQLCFGKGESPPHVQECGNSFTFGHGSRKRKAHRRTAGASASFGRPWNEAIRIDAERYLHNPIVGDTPGTQLFRRISGRRDEEIYEGRFNSHVLSELEVVLARYRDVPQNHRFRVPLSQGSHGLRQPVPYVEHRNRLTGEAGNAPRSLGVELLSSETTPSAPTEDAHTQETNGPVEKGIYASLDNHVRCGLPSALGQKRIDVHRT